jgi:hypothetical protein
VKILKNQKPRGTSTFENFQEGISKTQHQGSFNFGKFQEPKTSTKIKELPNIGFIKFQESQRKNSR